MASYVTPQYGVEYIFYVSLVSQANAKIMQSNPTIASGDWKVSKDGGALANLSTLPAVTPASSKLVKVTVSATEMQADNVTIIFSDASGDETCDIVINIQTSVRRIDDLAYPTTSGRSIDVTATGAVGVDWGNVENPTTTVALTGTTAGLIDGAITAAKIAADAITDAKVASDVTIASVTGAVGSVTGAVGSVTGNVGGNVAGSVASVTAGVTLAANAVSAAAVAADAVTELQSGLATAAAVAALNNLSAAQVNAEVDTAISDVGLTTTITGRIDAAVSTRATPAQVNTEMLDVLVTDTFAQPSAVPAATNSIKNMLTWLFLLARNKVTQSGTTQTAYADDGSTTVATAGVSDDGSVATRNEWS